MPEADRARRPAVVRARGPLPDLQRGLLGDRRRRLDAAGALRRGDAARPRARRADAGRAGGARPGRADGDSRRRAPKARTGPNGEPVLLLDQDRSRWDRLLIQPRPGGAGLAAQAPAARTARTRCRRRSRPATRAPGRAEETDWARDRGAVRGAGQRQPSPVIELNRGGRGGDGVRARRRAWSSSTRGARSRAAGLPPAAQRPRRPAGEARPVEEARAEFQRAAAMTRNAREQRLLLDRAASCAPVSG